MKNFYNSGLTGLAGKFISGMKQSFVAPKVMMILFGLSMFLVGMNANAQCPDFTGPTIDVQPSAIAFECDGTGNAGDLATWLGNNGGASASDPCGPVTWMNDYNPGNFVATCGNAGFVTVIFTAIDNDGFTTNTDTATFFIFDTTAPTLTCPPNDVADNDMGICGALRSPFVPIVNSEACNGIGSITPTTTTSFATPFPIGNTVVTWTASDACGNNSTCSTTIVVTDVESPYAASPNDLILTITPVGSSNLDEVSWSIIDDNTLNTVAAGGGYGPFSSNTHIINLTSTTLYTFRITTEAGGLDDNVANWNLTCNGGVVTSGTVGNPAGPSDSVIVSGLGACTGIDTLFNTDPLTCLYTHSGTSLDPVVVENCGTYTTSFITAGATNGFGNTTLDGYNFDPGLTTVTWTTTDQYGNTTTNSYDVLVEDVAPPVITTPASNDTAECDGAGNSAELNTWLSNNGNAVAFDPCGPVTWTNDYNPGNFVPGCGATGSVTVTFTATGADALFSQTTATFVIEDTTPPTITCAPDDSTVNDFGTCGAMRIAFPPSVGVDVCDPTPITPTTTADFNVPFPVGVTPVIWTATDACLNTNTCTQNIVVLDVEEPHVACPNCVVLSISGVGTSNLDEVSWSVIDEGTTNTVASGGGYGPFSTNTHVIDLSAGGPFTFRITTEAGGLDDNVANWSLSCNGALLNSGTVGNAGGPSDSTIVTGITACTSIDTSFITDPGVCSYTHIDNSLDPIVIENCMAPVPPVTVFTAATIPPTGTTLNGVEFPLGITTVTWTSTDQYGNTSSCSFDVLVEDTENPTIICPPDTTIPNDPGFCSAAVGIPCPPSSDFAGAYDPTNWTLNLTNSDGTVNTGAAPVSIDIISGDNGSSNPGETDFSIPFSCNAIITFDWSYTTTDGAGFDYPQYSLDGGATYNLFPNYNNAGPNNQSGSESINVPTGSTFVLNMETMDNINGAATVTISNFNIAPGPVFTLGTPVTADNCTVVSVTNDAPGTFPLGPTVVTWTVTDQSGNTATCTQTLTVVDAEDPTITCAPDQFQPNDPGLCEANVTVVAPTFNDNCPGAFIVNDWNSSSDASDVYPVGITNVIWTVTDGAGNTATCVQVITVNDTEVPVITCPADITVDADPGVCSAVISIGTATATDNCGVFSISSNDIGTYPVGVSLVTWIATDIHGNTSTCIQTITVNDVEPPVITCNPDITVSNDPGICGAVVTYAEPVVTDNCEAGYTLSSCAYAGLMPQTSPTNIVTGDDATVTIPVGFPFEFNNVPVGNITVSTNGFISMDVNNGDGCCNGNPLPDAFYVNQVNLMWLDNMSTVNYSVEGAPGSQIMVFEFNGIEFGTGNPMQGQIQLYETTNEIRLVISNANATGHFGTEGININGTSAIPVPGRNSVMPFTVSNDCQSFMPTIIDTVMLTGLPSGATFPVGTTVVTYQATDDSGNTATCSFTVTVNDTELPLISCQPDTVVGTDPTFCTAVVNGIEPVSFSDNCFIDSLSFVITGAGAVPSSGLNDASGATFNLGVSTVTYTVTDTSGNTATCSFTVTVNDTEFPTISCPADVVQANDIGFCGAVVNGIAPVTFNDNCPGAVVTYVITGVTTGSGGADASGTFFDIGTSTVTYTITDGASNVTTCSFTVTITESEPPIITCPLDIVVPNDPGICGAVVTFLDATATDNCIVISVVQTAGLPSGSTFPVGVSVVEYTATDGVGNTSTCTFSITVNDTEPPVLVCPPDVTLSAITGSCEQNHSWTIPIPTDNCGMLSFTVASDNPSVNIINVGPSAFALFPVGVTTITYTATDIYANVSTCSFTVTIVDDQDPIITNCPTDITMNNDPGDCGAIVTWVAPTASDNCPGVIMTSTNAPGSFFPVGTTTVTYAAVDASGNVDTCQFDVTINDTEIPSITCPADVNVNTDAGTCDATGIALGAPVTADNCAVATVVNDAVEPYAIGTTTVTWTVTDVNGNTNTCTQLVIVTDMEIPTIVCNPDTTVNNDPGVCGAAVIMSMPATSDNCGVAGVTNDAPALFPVGTTTVTFTVTDVNGNTNTCTRLVTVIDAEVPVILCPADVVLTTDPGTCTSMGPIGSPITSDNCGVASVTNDAVLPFGLGNTTVTWTVTDNAGLTATCTQLVTVNDGEAPTITCPADVNVNTDPGVCTASAVVLGVPVTNDNCGVATTTNDAPATFNLGTTTVTWTVTDNGGLTATCTQLVTVTDVELPTILCPADVAVNTDPGLCTASGVVLGAPTTNDNCSVASVTNDAPATYPVGVTTVTWTVTDGSGNTATCAQLVTVTDIELPIVNCPVDITTAAAFGLCSEVIATNPATFSDNCTVTTLTWTLTGATTASSPLTGINQVGTQNFNVGATVVTYTVTDASGNTSTCTYTITIQDTQVPAITCPVDITIPVDLGICTSSTPIGVPVTSDNCAVATVVESPVGPYPLGVTVVTWTVTDVNGNTNTCTQTVTVIDTQVPTILCPADIAVNNDPGVCGATVALGSPTTGDNCSVASTTNDAPALFPVGVTTVTWTVTDGSGNTATCTQLVTVTDNEVPSITCPADVVLPTDPGLCSSMGPIGTPTTSDNCGVASVVNDAVLPFPVGPTTVTWTVTDVNGNTNTCTQLVTVNDTEIPSITCPADVNVNTDPGSCDATGVALGAPVTNDNCGVATVVNDAVEPYALGTTIVTWTVTDVNGNTNTCTQSVTVTDVELPTILCPADVAVNTDPGLCTASGVVLGAPTTNDNCSVASVTNDAPATYPVGVTTVTWTVTDGSGNTATCAQLVTVTDIELPIVNCPVDITTAAAFGLCSEVIATNPATFSDNCTVTTLTWTLTGATTASSPLTGINQVGTQNFNVGATVVTYTVTDASGNTSTCTYTITIQDTQVPAITCPVDITIPVDLGICTSSTPIGVPVTSDNCAVATVVESPVGPYPLGVTVVTWTVTDVNGNTNTCTQTVTVIDTQLPVIACAGDTTVANDPGVCGATIALFAPVTSDNCSVASVTNDAPALFPVGVTTVTWTVTDGSGNTATCVQQVTVNDTELPLITCPADTTLSTDPGLCSSMGPIGTPVTSDNCGVASVVNDATFPLGVGTTTVTWTVTDVNGNTNTCTQLVTVVDTELPLITCPADVNVNTDPGVCDATGVALGAPITSDNCGVATVINDGLATYPLGTTVVTWTVTDVNGNTNTCTQLVIVTDIELPTIACAADTTVGNDPGVCGASIVLNAPVVSDNCSIASLTNDAPAVFPVGTTTVTWTVTDGSGNTATCIQMVTVNDIEAPVFVTCPVDIIVSNTPGLCGASVNYPIPTFTDNCSATMVQTDGTGFTSGNFFPIGTTVQTYVITDGAGNTASCSFTITVNDTELPVITACPSDITVSNDPGDCGAIVNWAAPTASDNCPGVTLVTTNIPGSFFPVGATIVTYTATDASGNTATCTFTVTVNDTELPVIACPADVNVNTDPGVCDATGVVLGTPTTSDNCGIASVVNDGLVTYPLGTTVVTWTVTDVNGNTATCTQLVTVTDVELPTILCPADIAVNNDPGLCGAVVALGIPVTADNCSVASVTNDGPGFFPVGVTIVTWTVTDGSGNTATCTQMVTVTDNEAPVPDAAILPTMIGQCTASVATPTATDNCAGTVLGTTTDPTNYNTQGTFVVTWTYDDGNGNITTQTQTVIVNDTIAPNPLVAVLPVVTGECSATVTAPSAMDNCEGIIVGTTLDPTTYSTQGTFIVTWTYDDGNGNITTQTQTVIVDDVTAPVANVDPLPNVVGECSVTVSTTPTAIDNCTGIIVGTTTDPLVYSTQGTFVITWTYDDGNGNVTTQTQTVVVDDVTAPVPDVAVLPTETGDCSVTVVTTPTATDNCSGSIVGTTTDPLVYSTQGTFVITWTYDDGNGNITTQTQTVIVDDITAPVPDVASLPVVTGECSATIAAPPTATDNCTGSITGTTTDPLSYTTQGTFIVTWIYDDGNGNVTTQTQTVMVDDVTAPVPDVAILTDVTGDCNATVTVIPTATDNCNGTITATTTNPLTYTAQGTYTITWTYDDGNGNITTQTQLVVVDDITGPTPDVAVLPTITEECSATLTPPTATDNCTGSVTASTFDPLTYTAQGTYIVTWYYFDGNGNTTTQTQTVIISDVTGPVPDMAVLNTVTGDCSAAVLSAPTATDNCSGSVTGTTTDPLVYTVEGTYIITWTYTDASGNTTTQTQTVIVDDATAPVPDAISLQPVVGQCTATVTEIPTATDNCAGTIVGITTDSLTYNTAGIYIITWVFDDGNGNITTQTQAVIVLDTQAPVPDQAFLPNVVGTCAVTVMTAPTATDNCMGSIVGTTSDPLSYGTPGTYIITWVFDDGNGNSITQNQTVIVQDCLGIDPSGEDVSLNIYPNPSNGIITVELSDMPDGNTEIRVMNEIGQVVYVSQLNAQISTIDLSTLRAANYYVQVITPNAHYTKTIIITHKY